MTMQEIQGKSFVNQTLVIDEKILTECTVKDSTIIFGGGDHAWFDTKFDNCMMRFEGPALTTIRFLQAFGKLSEQMSRDMGFEPVRDPEKKVLEDEIAKARTVLLAIRRHIESDQKTDGLTRRVRITVSQLIDSYFTPQSSGLSESGSDVKA